MTRKKILQYPTTPNIEEYKQQRPRARRIIKKKKSDHHLNTIREMEENRQNNRIKKYFQGITKHKTGYQPRTENFLTINNGQLITNEREILNTSANYLTKR